MIRKSVLMTSVAASIALIPATRASADAGDFIAGAIVGAIVNHAAKQPRKKVYKKTYTQKKVSKPRIPATQTGRQIQTSLNYFGFNAGAVDGQLGRNSRNAISQYQAYLGYAATGQLSTFEQDLLINSYNRAQAGGYATNQLIAANPEGVRGLLKQFRQEMAGGAPVMAGGVVPPQTTTVVTPSQQMVMAPAPAPIAPAPVAVATAPAPVAPAPIAPAPAATVAVPAPVAVAVAPAPAAPVAPAAIAPAPVAAAPVAPAAVATVVAPTAQASGGALPNLFGSSPVSQAALSTHCAGVAEAAAANGGYVTLSNMSDPAVALEQQFCLARQSVIAEGTQLAQGLGAGPAQLETHCAAYGQQMAPFVAELGEKGRDTLIGEVSAFAKATGIPTADLAATAKICMSVGYKADNMDQAIGSGLLVVAVGESGYGELMGHHLAHGMGAPERGDLAASWYKGAFAAAESQPVLATARDDRIELMRQANAALNGGQASLAPLAPLAPQPASALPTFQINQ